MTERLTVTWRRSSFSNGGGACVELAILPGDRIAARDSKAPASGVLLFPRAGLTSLIRAAGSLR